mmetsp:Transcript_32665/g.90069  ORF Transcript_32665/g.90069 Transcript_32665/m.90069 type:complete len:577 (+) Transcript_32665:175-1905(+)
MLGRKAILHTAKQGKRKWQLEQEKIDGASSDNESSEDGDLPLGAGADADAAEPEVEEVKEAQPKIESDRKPAKDASDSGSEDGGKTKRFAWMDSDDEASDGGDEVGAGAGADAGRGRDGAQEAPGKASEGLREALSAPAATGDTPVGGAATPSQPTQPTPAPGTTAGTAAREVGTALSAGPGVAVASLPVPLVAGARPGLIRPLRPPPVLPPGARLPILSQAHLQLMGQIAGTRSLDDLCDVIDRRYEAFAPSHAAIALNRLATLASASTGDALDAKLEKNSSFLRLCDRVDELLATAKGRESFMAADLAMVTTALAKTVQSPATGGAVGRIFGELADEVESRFTTELTSFTAPMLGDLIWGITKSGNARVAFLRATISAIAPAKLREMTCQDLANLAEALADQTFDKADDLLRGVIDQTKQRLEYTPPPTSPLAGVTTVPLPPTVAIPLVAGMEVPPPDGVPAANAGNTEAPTKTPSQDIQPLWQLTGQWRFSGSQISEITSAVAKHIGLYNEKLFHLVAQQFVQRLQDFTVPQLQKLRDAFDLVRHGQDFEFLLALRTSLKQREFAYRRTAYRR